MSRVPVLRSPCEVLELFPSTEQMQALLVHTLVEALCLSCSLGITVPLLSITYQLSQTSRAKETLRVYGCLQLVQRTHVPFSAPTPGSSQPSLTLVPGAPTLSPSLHGDLHSNVHKLT